MSSFVDTSALYAYLSADDSHHTGARSALDERLGRERLVTHAYVIAETAAIVHRRLSGRAVTAFFDGLAPALEVGMVGEDLHQAAVAAYLAALPSTVSFVDRTSFEFMRRRRIDVAIAFDPAFTAEGFTTLVS